MYIFLAELHKFKLILIFSLVTLFANFIRENSLVYGFLININFPLNWQNTSLTTILLSTIFIFFVFEKMRDDNIDDEDKCLYWAGIHWSIFAVIYSLDLLIGYWYIINIIFDIFKIIFVFLSLVCLYLFCYDKNHGTTQ